MIHKVITVKQPWASLIVQGLKPIENRTWKCPNKYIGKRILIHAGATPVREGWDALTHEQRLFLPVEIPIKKLPTSAIIGSVEIVCCVQNHPSIWAEKGVYNWVLANPIFFDKPIEGVKGKLSFWEYELLEEYERGQE